LHEKRPLIYNSSTWRYKSIPHKWRFHAWSFMQN
jgi:hypothetical protein